MKMGWRLRCSSVFELSTRLVVIDAQYTLSYAHELFANYFDLSLTALRSGLASAYELMHAGCNVTLLEGRHRVGGPVLSLPNLVRGKSVEAGGEFIGRNHPTWLAYAEQADLCCAVLSQDLMKISGLLGKGIDGSGNPLHAEAPGWAPTHTDSPRQDI
jgi:hypothetical protein